MTRRTCLFVALAAGLMLLAGCTSSDPVKETAVRELKVTTTDNYLHDADGRYVHLRGVNLGGNTKVPVLTTKEDKGFTYGSFDYRRCQLGDGGVGYCPYLSCKEDDTGACECQEACKSKDDIVKADPTAFTKPGRPFPLAEGDTWFGQIQSLGFNSVRLLFMWEAFYPEAKGKLDHRFVNYLDEVTAEAQEHDIYVLYNMHENLWSRHLGQHFNNFPVCQTCCVYDENDHPVKPDGTVLTDKVCTDKDPSEDPASKKACCLQGSIENQIWSLVPSTPTADIMKGISTDDTAAAKAARGAAYIKAYNDSMGGDGAPLWASKICLPEKNFDSPYWGVFKLLGTMQKGNLPSSPDDMSDFYTQLSGVFAYLDGQAQSGTPAIDDATRLKVEQVFNNIEKYLPPEGFNMEDTNDFFPFTWWAADAGVSLNTNRCYAAFFAGDKVWPNARVVESSVSDNTDDGVDTKSFLKLEDAEAYAAQLTAAGKKNVTLKTLSESMQESYRDVWRTVAHVGKKYTNVAGYDMMNEPSMVWVMLTATALSFQYAGQDALRTALIDLLSSLTNNTEVLGKPVGELVFNVLNLLDLLPPDWNAKVKVDSSCTSNCTMKDKYTAAEKKQMEADARVRWGMTGIDSNAALTLTTGSVDKTLLQPLFEYLGAGILDEYCPTNDAGEAVCVANGRKPILWVESTLSLNALLQSFEGSSSTGGQWLEYMTRPQYDSKYGDVPMVYSPHWYPDIYPTIGLNQPSREFVRNQYTYRNLMNNLDSTAALSQYELENMPVVYGEFGTYWNYRVAETDKGCVSQGCVCGTSNTTCKDTCSPKMKLCRPGYQQAPFSGYLPENEADIYAGKAPVDSPDTADAYYFSSQILDNFYESFEGLFMSNIQWCFTAGGCNPDGEACQPSSSACTIDPSDPTKLIGDNCTWIRDLTKGDLWDHEDFSISDQWGRPRGWIAYSRPYPRSLSGKPISMHFYSPLHTFNDTDKGKVNPVREFAVSFQSKKTDASSILYVPTRQYHDGFYVWLSDGWVTWDKDRQLLFFHPTADTPDTIHTVTIRPPIEGQDISGWNYFITGDKVLTR